MRLSTNGCSNSDVSLVLRLLDSISTDIEKASVGLELEVDEGRVRLAKVGVEGGVPLKVDRIDAAPKTVSSDGA